MNKNIIDKMGTKEIREIWKGLSESGYMIEKSYETGYAPFVHYITNKTKDSITTSYLSTFANFKTKINRVDYGKFHNQYKYKAEITVTKNKVNPIVAGNTISTKSKKDILNFEKISKEEALRLIDECCSVNNYDVDEVKRKLGFSTNLQPSPVSVINFDVSRIHTDVKRFQNRQNEYSEDSKNRIVKAYKDGEFDFAKFDPITIWYDTNKDKYFVLSGHSRLAAFRELSKIDSTFANIPARIFAGTEAAAIDLALNSNVLSTKESDMERAIYYHNQRNQCEISSHVSGLGATINCAQIVENKCRENESKNAPYILSLSYLNPDGFLADSMKRVGADKGSDDANIIRTIAGWVGDIRKRFPDVSDAQETEIAKYLIDGGYGSKSRQFKNKEKFILRFQYAFDKWQKRGADPSESLNLANSISKSSFEKDYDARLAKAEQDYQEAKADYEQKHNRYWAAVTKGEITLDKMNELEKPLVDYVNKCLDEKKRIMGQKDDVKKANAAQYTLWGVRRRGRRCRKY